MCAKHIKVNQTGGKKQQKVNLYRLHNKKETLKMNQLMYPLSVMAAFWYYVRLHPVIMGNQACPTSPLIIQNLQNC